MKKKRGAEPLIADVHVFFVVIVVPVNVGLLRAVTFYRLRRQSRVVRFLPGPPLLPAVIALFLRIVIPGDLREENQRM